jgi:hypothetical protein
MWKIGESRTSDTKKITKIPIIFIPNPALIKSIVFICPFTNIIALGGVAIHKS